MEQESEVVALKTDDYGAEDDVAPPYDELFFGLVRAIGTDLSEPMAIMQQILYEAGFRVRTIKLSSLLADGPNLPLEPAGSQNRYRYYVTRMDAGDRARKLSNDRLAQLAIQRIKSHRNEMLQGHGHGEPRLAYIFDSLMHPQEVQTLRAVYGEHFFLVGVYEDEERRREKLITSLVSSMEAENRSPAELADELVRRDRGIGGLPHCVAIERTFHLSDVFVDVQNPRSGSSRDDGKGLSERTVNRLFEQIFSSRNHTPTVHETAMAFAYAEANGSGNLARRVGAAILDAESEIIAVGFNDVPAPGGGLYPVYELTTGDILDYRDHRFTPSAIQEGLEEQYGYDANDLVKFQLFDDLIRVLKDSNLLAEDVSTEVLLASDIANAGSLRRAKLFDIIEYGRSVHAEMAALMSALRRGVSVVGSSLYVTTFPCHECARHIIAAGIDRVIYLEPYPKSRVRGLHSDAIRLGQRTEEERARKRRPVEFVPFIGIAPGRHAQLYSFVDRKDQFGERFPPGRAKQAKAESAISHAAPLRWSSAHPLLKVVSPLQRGYSEDAVTLTAQQAGDQEVLDDGQAP